jgi:hypothetical protein
MPEEMNHPPNDLEAALAQLRPAVTQLDPASIRLAAEQRLARRQLRRWQAVAAGLAMALGVSLLLRSQPQQVERFVYVPGQIEEPEPQAPTVAYPTPAPPAPSLPPAPRHAMPAPPMRPLSPDSNYLVLRQQVLEHGLDALPPSPCGGSTSPPVSLLALRQQMRLDDFSSADIRLFPWDR